MLFFVGMTERVASPAKYSLSIIYKNSGELNSLFNSLMLRYLIMRMAEK